MSTPRWSVARAVRAIEGALDGRTHALLTLSEHEEAEAPRARPTERVRPIIDLRDFTPLSEVDRRAARLELGWHNDERIHLCVGRLCPGKPQRALAQAWRKHAGPGDRLLLVGDGEDRPAIEGLAGDNIELLGWRNDMARLMGAADALLVPSLGEGFSLVILEALACGTPVFSTSVGGSEIIAAGDGRIVTTAEEVVRAALASPLTPASAEDRVTRAERHHTFASLDTVAEEFLAIYHRTAGRDRSTIDLREETADRPAESAH